MNVFIVSSPLQVINAKEAIEHFNIRNYRLIVAKGKGKKNELLDVLNLLKIKNVIEIEFSTLIELIVNNSYYDRFKQSSSIFIGDYEDFAQKIILKKIKIICNMNH